MKPITAKAPVPRCLSTANLLLMFLALAAGAVSAATETNLVMNHAKTELATFGGGCFWCLEAMYQTVDGVTKVTSGYAGGHVSKPTYEQVCGGATGHAEVVQLEFDPSRITYEKLLDLFWKAHDPTTLNAQGPDSGTQYRSIILYQDEHQKKIAEHSKDQAARHFASPIVTQIVPLQQFYPAEAYHQNYFRNHPEAGYCRMVIQPKLDKFLKK
jgi:peptide-methionine (S)-S-oxide reductase